MDIRCSEALRPVDQACEACVDEWKKWEAKESTRAMPTVLYMTHVSNDLPPLLAIHTRAPLSKMVCDLRSAMGTPVDDSHVFWSHAKTI